MSFLLTAANRVNSTLIPRFSEVNLHQKVEKNIGVVLILNAPQMGLNEHAVLAHRRAINTAAFVNYPRSSISLKSLPVRF